MKKIIHVFLGGTFCFLTSCSTTTPVGNVEALERQAPITGDPNAIGDAINAGNAVNYSNGRRAGGNFLGF